MASKNGKKPETRMEARFRRLEIDDHGNVREYTKRVRPQDLVGTAEAAELLDVEAPRIGRWLQKGDMPQPVVWLAAGPVWKRQHIEAVRATREGRRRRPVGV